MKEAGIDQGAVSGQEILTTCDLRIWAAPALKLVYSDWVCKLAWFGNAIQVETFTKSVNQLMILMLGHVQFIMDCYADVKRQESGALSTMTSKSF